MYTPEINKNKIFDGPTENGPAPLHLLKHASPEDPMYNEIAFGDEHDSSNWTSRGIGKVVANSILWLELLPTNEVIRSVATFAVYGATRSPGLTAATLGFSTLIVEAGGSVVAADMLDRGMAEKTTEKIRNRLSKWKLTKNMRTNLPIEAGIGLTLGSPAALITKDYQDPERSRSENRKYGLAMSLGTAAVLATESYAAAEGIRHPSPETIGIALLGLGVIGGAYGWARKRFKAKTKLVDNQGPEPIIDMLEPSSLTNEGGDL